MGTSGEVTRLLRDWSDGRREALDKLLPLVYNELRRLAHSYLTHERPDHTLQTTALVHEAYLKLVDQRSVNWQNHGQFFALSAQDLESAADMVNQIETIRGQLEKLIGSLSGNADVRSAAGALQSHRKAVAIQRQRISNSRPLFCSLSMRKPEKAELITRNEICLCDSTHRLNPQQCSTEWLDRPESRRVGFLTSGH